MDIDSSAEQLSQVAFKAFFNISSAWNLDDDEARKLLGSPDLTTFSKWRDDPGSAVLHSNTLERISYILGIYKALQTLLPDEIAADGWVKKPNSAPLFNGESALDKMVSGDKKDLSLVRQYLDAQSNS